MDTEAPGCLCVHLEASAHVSLLIPYVYTQSFPFPVWKVEKSAEQTYISKSILSSVLKRPFVVYNMLLDVNCKQACITPLKVFCHLIFITNKTLVTRCKTKPYQKPTLCRLCALESVSSTRGKDPGARKYYQQSSLHKSLAWTWCRVESRRREDCHDKDNRYT